MDQARSVCGKAARMAQIIDRVQPWSSALYAALTAAAAAQLRGAREAPIGRVAVRRFSPAARLLAACLRNQDGTTGCLVRKLMVASPEPDANFQRVHFDASPWGGGAVLFEDNVITEWMAVKWDIQDLWHDCQIVAGDRSFKLSGSSSCSSWHWSVGEHAAST